MSWGRTLKLRRELPWEARPLARKREALGQQKGWGPGALRDEVVSCEEGPGLGVVSKGWGIGEGACLKWRS